MPMTSFSFAPIVPEGYQLAEGQADVPVWTNSVDEQYFSTLDIPLLHGRLFEPTDDANAPRVVIVNDTLASHYWAGSNPIGKQVILPGRSSPSAAEVVGIVKTTTYGLPGEQPQEAIFLPYRQQPHGRMTLLVRTSGDSAALLDPLRQLVERIDRDVPVSELQTIEAFYELRIVAAGNILVGLITAMGLMGLTLTMVGLYGLVSYAVNRRTREIGIRIAIGASYSRIVTMVLRQGMAPAWLGLAAGLVLSGVTGRLMMQAAPFPDAVDIRSYAFVVPIVAAVTALAAFIPARRAAQVNPTVALRCE
jgi:ABC-type antimicrobial peptide transport system permease subunit